MKWFIVLCVAVALSVTGTASAALVAGWDFEGNLDDKAGNLPGTGYDISYVNDAGGNGKGASSVLYLNSDADGKNSYVDIENSAGVNLDSMTVAVWAKLEAGHNPDGGSAWDEHAAIFVKGDQQFRLSRRAWDNLIQWNITGHGMGPYDSQTSNPVQPTDGEWHHYAGTYDHGTKEQSLWVDGERVSHRTLQADANPGENNYNIEFGRNKQAIDLGYGGAPRAWIGWIDEGYIYDTALGEGEIKLLAGIPEPASASLVLLGLLGLTPLWRRR